MNQSNQPKRNHHILPKLYLKGFIEEEKRPFVWIYDRDKPYLPGSKSHHNPRRLPISKAGVEKDHYAFKQQDGLVNFDKYENELEKIEKPSDEIIRKIRQQKMLTLQEKVVFASYIFYMIKRVQKRSEHLKKLWPEPYNSVSSDIFDWLDFEDARTSSDDLHRSEKIKNLRSEAKDILEFYKENFLDSEIPLKVIVDGSLLGIPQMLAAMTWQFYLAPPGKEYVTGDNPIFNNGIDKSYAEISFPISKDIALVMSWYNIKEGYFDATPEIVMEINQRTSSNSQKELYCSTSESWIVDLFNNKREGYYLIYAYAASLFK